MKLIYKPFGMIVGLIAGLMARKLFGVIWGRIDDQEPPEALTEEASGAKVVTAAALQGAVMAGTRAAVNRSGAKGWRRLTGVWPGERRPDPVD